MVSDSAGNELTKSQSTFFGIKHDQTLSNIQVLEVNIFGAKPMYHPRSNTQTRNSASSLAAKCEKALPRAGTSNIENIWV